jgi:hypothetical protein
LEVSWVPTWGLEAGPNLNVLCCAVLLLLLYVSCCVLRGPCAWQVRFLDVASAIQALARTAGEQLTVNLKKWSPAGAWAIAIWVINNTTISK